MFRLSSGDVQVVIPGGTEADAARTRSILQTTGKLEVRHVYYQINNPSLLKDKGNGAWDFGQDYRNNYKKYRDVVYPQREKDGRSSGFLHLGPEVWNGSHIRKAHRDLDRSGEPAVAISLNPTGTAINLAFTTQLNAERESNALNQEEADLGGRPSSTTPGTVQKFGYLAICMDGEVVSAPVVREPSGGATQISGSFDEEEAQALVDILNAGALTVTPRVVSERVVGPSLGQETIDQGMRAMLIASALVVLAMFLFYHLKLGLVANLALLVNIALIFVVLSIFQATLTLPGLAGMVLTVGMAVDANILIFERMREENTGDLDVSSLIAKGYDRAFGTILDSNLTTFVVALILYAVGSGPIKGFD